MRGGVLKAYFLKYIMILFPRQYFTWGCLSFSRLCVKYNLQKSGTKAALADILRGHLNLRRQ